MDIEVKFRTENLLFSTSFWRTCRPIFPGEQGKLGAMLNMRPLPKAPSCPYFFAENVQVGTLNHSYVDIFRLNELCRTYGGVKGKRELKVKAFCTNFRFLIEIFWVVDTFHFYHVHLEYDIGVDCRGTIVVLLKVPLAESVLEVC